MTSYERFERIEAIMERIAERHAALAHTVEILALDQVAAEKRAEAADRRSEQDAQNIRALARIAEIHEQRLSHLEGDAR